jgi:tryptophan synthase alpha chain
VKNRIKKKFAVLTRTKKKAFIPFLTAGYPNFKATEELVLAFEKAGASIVELGVPFSDPIADGPVIQAASFAALKRGATLKKVLDLVKRLRQKTQVPLAVMTYFNPVLSYGLSRFIKDAVVCGLDALIIPDLPVEEEAVFVREANQRGLCVVQFIAPTTTLKRAKMIARKAKGFIYFVSLTGVTGAKKELPSGLESGLRQIKKIAGPVPVCAGFGVSTPDQVRKVSGWCDGVIVGSAIVKKITENLSSKKLVQNVAKFVSALATNH